MTNKYEVNTTNLTQEEVINRAFALKYLEKAIAKAKEQGEEDKVALLDHMAEYVCKHGDLTFNEGEV